MNEKTFELIKGLLNNGMSMKKIEQTLPDEIRVSRATIAKVDNAATYDEYIGKKPLPAPAPTQTMITPYAHSQKVCEAINGLGEKLDRLTELLEGLVNSLS